MKRTAVVFFLVLLLLCFGAFSAAAVQDELFDAAAQTGDQLFALVDDETGQTLSSFGLDDFSPESVFDVSWQSVRAFFSNTLSASLNAQWRSFTVSLSLLLVLAVCGVLLAGSDGADAFELLSLCAVTVHTAGSLHTYVSAAASVLQTEMISSTAAPAMILSWAATALIHTSSQRATTTILSTSGAMRRA